jgi:hypothetical protein
MSRLATLTVDLACAALQDEARPRLPTADLVDRVAVTATRPARDPVDRGRDGSGQ